MHARRAAAHTLQGLRRFPNCRQMRHAFEAVVHKLHGPAARVVRPVSSYMRTAEGGHAGLVRADMDGTTVGLQRPQTR
jgi:hypothetical protein